VSFGVLKPMKRSIHVLMVAAAAFMLAACAVPIGSGPDPSAAGSTRPAATGLDLATLPESAAPVIGEIPEPLMAALLADVADRAGVDPEAIEVVRAENVTWNDGSLGCPEPGMNYTMALIDGYQVVLSAGGDEFDYRVTGDGAFRLCENGGRPSG
jgi:predicted small secreted protein